MLWRETRSRSNTSMFGYDQSILRVHSEFNPEHLQLIRSPSDLVANQREIYYKCDLIIRLRYEFPGKANEIIHS